MGFLNESVLRWLEVIACASVFIVCDSLSARWGHSGKDVIMHFVIPLAPLGYILFGVLNRQSSLSVNSGLVNSVIVISTICIGVFFFGDDLSFRQMMGLGMAVLAVVLLA